MRWSRLFIPTLRDDPADAEAVSHRLMLRAGLIRQLGAGIYSKLPVAFRVLRRIEAIVREEMDRIGGQEFRLPELHPAEPWKQSGRWNDVGDELFRIRDRKQADLCLAMTAEEIFTSIARDELRSYRQLPQIWYQIGTKFRDEPRPKSGVLRGREFCMKDAYSFDVDFPGLDRSFDLIAEAYRRIFDRCGIQAIPVEASSGSMGGSESVEFTVFSDAGEDWVVVCPGCDYAANLEKADSVPTSIDDPVDTAAVEKFPTPGVRTIDDLARFEGGASAEHQIKTLVYLIDDKLTLFLMRGDHELNEVKVAEATGTTQFRPATAEECVQALGANPGSLGAVGVTNLPIFADQALRGRRGMTTGANEDDFHLRHVDVERDIPQPVWSTLRSVEAGEACLRCGKPLEVRKSIEVGHIFKLGLRYSESMGASILTQEGKEVPVVMGSYGIGMERIMAAAIESHHDENGIVWPISIAPFHVVVSPVKMKDPEQAEKSERIYRELLDAGFDALLDDRDERPGVKFKDADLVGIPFRIVPGPRALAKGCVELVSRADGETVEIPLDDVVSELEKEDAMSESALTMLSEEEQIFRQTIREFADRELTPRVAKMDKQGHYDPEIIPMLFDLGIMAIETPEEWGGWNVFLSALAVEEISRADASVGVLVDVQNTLVANALLRWGSPELKERVLSRMAGGVVTSYALSEAAAGSDAFALQTRAVADGDEFVLTGRKLWITNAAEAGLFLIMANANPDAGYRGITTFIVDRDTPGFSVGQKEDKLGIRASSTCELILDGARVPRSNVVGEVGQGYKIAIETLNEGRIGIGAQMVGIAQGALEDSLAYTAERKQFGQPIGDFQSVQFELAQMATELEAARLMVYNAARLKDAGEVFLTQAAMTKLFCSQVAERVTSQAVELFGGVGYTREYPVEKRYRDAKIGKIYEGTSHMQLQTIAKQIQRGA